MKNFDENSKRDFKGIWIERAIWLDEELCHSEKFLLAEIDSLSSNGECYAGNEWFAKFLKLSKDRISKLISGLRKKGYIEVELIYNDNSKQIKKRVITTDGFKEKIIQQLEAEKVKKKTKKQNSEESGNIEQISNGTVLPEARATVPTPSQENVNSKGAAEQPIGKKEIIETPDAISIQVLVNKQLIKSNEKFNLTWGDTVMNLCDRLAKNKAPPKVNGVPVDVLEILKAIEKGLAEDIKAFEKLLATWKWPNDKHLGTQGNQSSNKYGYLISMIYNEFF